MKEVLDKINELGQTFEAFKADNDKVLAEIKAKGHADPLLVEKVEKMNADISNIAAMKAQLERLEALNAAKDFPGGGKNQSGPKAEYAKAFESFIRTGADAGLKDLSVKAAMTTSSDPDGGFVVPVELDKTIGRVALTVSAMRGLARVITIGTKTYEKLVTTAGATAEWVTEAQTRSETDTPTMSKVTIETKELSAKPKVTQELLDDASVDITAYLGEEVSMAFAAAENTAFITGSGVGAPKGVASYTMVANASYAWGSVGYTTSGHATLLNNADKLFDLDNALKAIYKAGASFVMNSATELVIRQMKDGNGNYIWAPGLQVGAPSVLLGKPVVLDDNVASIGAGAYPIFFGNFLLGYTIVDRMGTRVLRDPYSSKPYVEFYTTKRVGAGITNYEAIKALKISA